MPVIKKILSNKIFLYLTTRYFTYIIQFCVSMFLAVKLGPYYFGMWSFIYMILSYFLVINFGISNSTNILLIQNKNNSEASRSYILTAILLLCIITILIFLFALYYYKIGIALFDKYQLEPLFYLICIIAVFQHFNLLFSGIYRVKNRLFELSFYQSIVPVLTLILAFCFKSSLLINMLLYGYLAGHIISLSLFLYRKQITFRGGVISLDIIKSMFSKGIYLFLYNCCFYLIIVSTATIVSAFYSNNEYGLYSFAYTAGHSIILFLEAFAFIIFPKLIDRLRDKDNRVIQNTIRQIRVSYISTAYLLGYVAFAFLPPLVALIPKYQETNIALSMVILSILPHTSSYSYYSLLMANNQEKKLSFISIIALCTNIAIGLLLVLVFKVTYQYVILSTMISYFIFAILSIYYALKYLSLPITLKSFLSNCFPFPISYSLAILIVIFQINYLSILPLIVFLFINRKSILEIVATIKRLIYKPNIIDLN